MRPGPRPPTNCSTNSRTPSRPARTIMLYSCTAGCGRGARADDVHLHQRATTRCRARFLGNADLHCYPARSTVQLASRVPCGNHRSHPRASRPETRPPAEPPRPRLISSPASPPESTPTWLSSSCRRPRQLPQHASQAYSTLRLPVASAAYYPVGEGPGSDNIHADHVPRRFNFSTHIRRACGTIAAALRVAIQAVDTINDLCAQPSCCAIVTTSPYMHERARTAHQGRMCGRRARAQPRSRGEGVGGGGEVTVGAGGGWGS
jgi:hypothetical protein